MYKIESTYWWFLGKRWLMMKLLRERLGGRQDAVILDVGCGTGRNLEALSELGDTRGCDISSEALDFCRSSRHPDGKLRRNLAGHRRVPGRVAGPSRRGRQTRYVFHSSDSIGLQGSVRMNSTVMALATRLLR